MTNAIDELKSRLNEDEKDCAILVHEMSIKKEVHGIEKIKSLPATLIMGQF